MAVWAEELKQQDLKWFTKNNEKREERRDEARADLGISDFEITNSLRTAFYQDQRLDPTLSRYFSTKDAMPEGYRLGMDGVLERQVAGPVPAMLWVPVVPRGAATVNLSWRKWIFVQNHAGVGGAHRSEEKTYNLVSYLLVGYYEERH